MSDLIQSDYERLGQLAEIFGGKGEQSGEMDAAVRQRFEELRNGGWIGRGSDAFIAEMEDEILPANRRLIEALARARTVTLQIKQIIRQAEEEAAAPFRGSGGGVPVGSQTAVPGGAGPASAGGGSPGGTVGTPLPGGTATPRGVMDKATTYLEDNPMIGFRLFGVTFGGHQLVQALRGAQKASPAFKAVPIAGGIIGTVLNLAEANANGEDMAVASGREIAVGTLKTEVYLVPGLNIVAGVGELAHMTGVVDTNYTDAAVRAVAEPIHKHVLDPVSDGLADGMVYVDRGVRSLASDASDLIDNVEWPF